LDRAAARTRGLPFAACAPEQQDALLAALEKGELQEFAAPDGRSFFRMLLAHLQEGLFADPAYGGNRDKLGWRALGHPGIWLENSAQENLSAEPVTKGGIARALADLDWGSEDAAGGPAELLG